MKAHHFNADGAPLEAHDVRSNLVGFVSWSRLQAVFRMAGEIKSQEKIESWQVDDRGITFRVTDK